MVDLPTRFPLRSAAGIVCSALTILCCLCRPDPAAAQSRNWTSRFLPPQTSATTDDTDEVAERERGRYYRNLVRDENDVRREADRLSRLARNAQSFSSGSGSAAQQTAFVQLLKQVGAREQVAAVLQERIPALDTNNFSAEPFCDLVQPDGRLIEPPLVLQEGRARTTYATVQSAWSNVASSLSADPPKTPDANRFSRALRRWKSAFRSSAGRPGLTAGGLEVHTYFKRTDELLRVLGSGVERAELSAFLRQSGYPFSGGSVGDLVQHIVDHELTVQIGSPAHVVLSNLTQQMLLEAHADLAVLEDRIEYYKQQSVAAEEGQGSAGSRFRRGQSGATTPSLPRREAPGAAGPAEPPEARPERTERVVDRGEGPFLRREP